MCNHYCLFLDTISPFILTKEHGYAQLGVNEKLRDTYRWALNYKPNMKNMNELL